MVKHEGKYEDQLQQGMHPVVKAFIWFTVLVAMASLIASVS